MEVRGCAGFSFSRTYSGKSGAADTHGVLLFQNPNPCKLPNPHKPAPPFLQAPLPVSASPPPSLCEPVQQSY